MQDIPHSSCYAFAMKMYDCFFFTLNKHVKTISIEFQSFIELIVCDQHSEDMLGACSKCPKLLLQNQRKV